LLQALGDFMEYGDAVLRQRKISYNIEIAGLCAELGRICRMTHTPRLLVPKRTIPIERPQLVDIVPTFADRVVSRGQRNGSPKSLF
jgi:hypothetical protein